MKHQLETELFDREAEFRSLFELSPNAIFLVDSNCKVLICNEMAAKIAQLSKAEIIRGTISDMGLFSKEDLVQFKKNMIALTKGEPVTPAESRIHLKDGTTGCVEIRLSIVKKAGQSMTFQIIAREISEHEGIETEIKGTEEFYRELMSKVSLGIVIIDPKTHLIESANDAAAVMFGSHKEEIVGHRCHSYLCPAQEGACPVCDLGNELDNSERVMICANGSRRPILKTVVRTKIRGRKSSWSVSWTSQNASRQKKCLEKVKRNSEP